MVLVKKCKEIPEQDLFQYFDVAGNKRTVGSADINNYLKQITNHDFTAKDFRLCTGSVNTLSAFQEFKIPKNQSQSTRKINEVLDFVASNLGNTRTVCKKYYVHPTVIAAYNKGTICKYKSKKTVNMTQPVENSLVKLLKNEAISETYV